MKDLNTSTEVTQTTGPASAVEPVLGTVNYKLGDFDVWYQPCTKCGYDTGKSSIPKEGNKTCWRCGNYISRDYSARALKKVR